jgi:hypothetical protein
MYLRVFFGKGCYFSHARRDSAVAQKSEAGTMTSGLKGMLTAGGVVAVGAIAGLYALQARQMGPATPVVLESGGVTVYKTPT